MWIPRYPLVAPPLLCPQSSRRRNGTAASKPARVSNMSHSAAEALRRLPSDVSAAGQSLASGNRSTPFLGIESENRTVNPPWCRKPFPAIAKFLCGLLSIVAIGGIGFAIAAVVMEPKPAYAKMA